MKISILKNDYAIWIDYSNNPECLWVFEITEIDKEKIKNWSKLEIINDELVISDTPEYLENIKQKEKDLIEQEFQDTIKLITAWYSQAEIDSWERKIEEANKVIAGWTSAFLDSLCIWIETATDLATKILAKADEYALAYAGAEKVKREKLSALLYL